MHLTEVNSSCPNPAPPRRRCRHKRLTDRLKPSDECCPNCAGWTDTSAALLCGAIELCSISLVERNPTTIYSCSLAKRSQFLSTSPTACRNLLADIYKAAGRRPDRALPAALPRPFAPATSRSKRISEKCP